MHTVLDALQLGNQIEQVMMRCLARLEKLEGATGDDGFLESFGKSATEIRNRGAQVFALPFSIHARHSRIFLSTQDEGQRQMQNAISEVAFAMPEMPAASLGNQGFQVKGQEDCRLKYLPHPPTDSNN